MAHKTYIKHTNGKTAVFFIHGFLGSTEHFERFIPLLPDDIAVYNILLKGHGGSVRDFGETSMKEWKEQVSGAVDELVKQYSEIIIVAHSMGTFFAMEESIRRADRVKKLFLLAIPLKIGVKKAAFFNTFKSFFGLVSENDEAGRAYNNAHSIKLTKRVWEYIGWIPRYLELFAESKKARATILNIKVPCVIMQSAKDELVSVRSMRYIPKKDNIILHILSESAHFIYTKKDEEKMKEAFKNLLTKREWE